MKILGIETATSTTSVALQEEEKTLGQITTNTTIVHSKTLMPMIISLLDFTKTNINSIDVFAVSSGPGSFTGLRIGLAVTKGFAVAGSKPVAVVPTLEALAYNICFNAYFNKLVCAVLDARCNNVYAGLFEYDETGKLLRRWQDRTVSVNVLKEDLKKLSNELSKSVVLVGNAANLVCSDDCTFILKEGLILPSAVSVCRLAFDKKYWCAAGEAMPEYLKPPQIDVSKKMQNKKTEELQI